MSKGKKASPKKELSLKMKVILLITLPLIIIGLCSAAIVITVGTVVDEDTYSFEDETVLPELSQASDYLNGYCNGLIETASKANDIKVGNEISVSITDLESDATDAQKAFAAYLIPSVEGSLAAMYEKETCDYGGDASFLAIEEFKAAKIESKYSDDGKLVITQAYFEDTETSTEDRNVKILSDASAEKNAEFGISSIEISSASDEVTAEADIATGRLTKLILKKTYPVTCTIEFSGALEGLGVQSFSFNYSVTDTKTLSYAGIFIEEDSVSIEKNGFTTLGISANMAEGVADDEFTLTLTSSAPDTVKVSDNGMIEAAGEGQNITITATLEYLGNTYTDTCTVSAGTPVEGISISPKKATLTPGEEITLTAKLDPEDASVRGVIWKSEDSGICTVDENGTVKAVAEGDTRIIAISEDGHYMSATEIKVEGGGNK